jgi:hypothetical protein
MPTWTCSAHVGVRRSRPRICSPISLVALVDDVRARPPNRLAGWMPAPAGVPPAWRTTLRSASRWRAPSIASPLIGEAFSTSAS